MQCANPRGCGKVSGCLKPEASIALGKMWLFLTAQVKANDETCAFLGISLWLIGAAQGV